MKPVVGQITEHALMHVRNSARARRTRAGFTLMEMLIVIAIIAILIAIAIPLFTSQLENAKRAADEANARSAYAAALAQYMSDGMSGDASYVFDAGSGTVINSSSNPAAASGVTGYGQWEKEADYEVGGISVQGKANNGMTGYYVAVTIKDGAVTSVAWDGGNVYSSSTPQMMRTATPEQRKSFDDVVLQKLADSIASMSIDELNAVLGVDIRTYRKSSGGLAFKDRNGESIATMDISNASDGESLKAAIYGKGTSLFSQLGYGTAVTQGNYTTRVWSDNGESPFYSLGTGNNCTVSLKLDWNEETGEITSAEVWLSAPRSRYANSYADINSSNYKASSTK